MPAVRRHYGEGPAARRLPAPELLAGLLVAQHTGTALLDHERVSAEGVVKPIHVRHIETASWPGLGARQVPEPDALDPVAGVLAVVHIIGAARGQFQAVRGEGCPVYPLAQPPKHGPLLPPRAVPLPDMHVQTGCKS